MNDEEHPRETDAVAAVLAYHQRTKHHFGRYALSLGYLDWATQPDPFRRYPDATQIPLAHPQASDKPTWDELLDGRAIAPLAVNHASLSALFYESLAISAWKQLGDGPPWSLRINPSSGDLHPTEAYLVAGAIPGVSERPAVHHYCAYAHALEERLAIDERAWTLLAPQLPQGAFLIVLASIHWRESWKYGERAYRYCHHDAGHAIAAVALSAAIRGWRSRVVSGISDEDLETLTGVWSQNGPEREHADCALVVMPASDPLARSIPLELPAAAREVLRAGRWNGTPNRLSCEHHPWPLIDEVSVACRYHGEVMESPANVANAVDARRAIERNVPVCKLIRQRRSAVDMDGVTGITREAFYRLLLEVDPACQPYPFDVLPWEPQVSLALLVHRVHGVSPGLYLLCRERSHESELRQRLRPDFLWQRPDECPEQLALYRLLAGDARAAARAVCCHQDIAADGAFAAAMLARSEQTLRAHGAWMYPRLYWETGLIGQMLYLGAEAAGTRATGIGCFFDDAMHELLGITDQGWQSLYHFTVGAAVEDLRLTTLSPYWRLSGEK